MKKLTLSIPPDAKAPYARNIQNTIQRLSNGLSKGDVLMITVGPDGNFYHTIERRDFGDTLQDAARRLTNNLPHITF